MLSRLRLAALAAGLLTSALQPLTGTASATPVVGWVKITWTTPATAPIVTKGGVLSAWSCTQTAWPTATDFTVDCFPPTLVTTPWQCGVLHADSGTFNRGARLRTTMLCDNVLAAQTATAADVDWKFAWGTSGVTLREKFTCRIDNGAGLMAVPNFSAFCGDPPALPGL